MSVDISEQLEHVLEPHSAATKDLHDQSVCRREKVCLLCCRTLTADVISHAEKSNLRQVYRKPFRATRHHVTGGAIHLSIKPSEVK